MSNILKALDHSNRIQAIRLEPNLIQLIGWKDMPDVERQMDLLNSRIYQLFSDIEKLKREIESLSDDAYRACN